MRFRRGQKVLCCVGANGRWCPGVVVKVNYTLRPGEVVPYQVRLLDVARSNRLIWVQVDDDGACRELTGDNLIWLRVEPDVLKVSMTPLILDDEVEANRLLRRAVQVRNKPAAEFIATKAKIPVQLIGPELVQLAVQYDKDVIALSGPHLHHVEIAQNVLADLQAMMDWLENSCNAEVTCYSDERGRHAEHVAAENGDVILLLWLLTNKYGYTRCIDQHLRRPRNDDIRQSQGLLRWGLPRDYQECSPLHYAAANGHTNFVRCYLRGESRDTWLENIEDFDAVNSDGKSALDLAIDEATKESLYRLRKGIYQGILNNALHHGGSATVDHSNLLRLVVDYGLDLDQAISGEGDVFGHDAVLIALEDGCLARLQWIVEIAECANLSWESPEGLSMLHAAARRSESVRSQMEDMQRRIEEGQSWLSMHNDDLASKLHFMEAEWNGSPDFADEGNRYCNRRNDHFSSAFRGIVSDYENHCKGTHQTPDRIEVCRWLIRQGVALPRCRFIVQECDFPTAKFLLEYRLTADSTVDSLFRDQAPIAMEMIKEYLYGEGPEALLSSSDIAMLSVRRPQCDQIHSITDASRLLLLHWLVAEGFVNINQIKSSTGGTILHEAVRSKETVIATWLAMNYPKLAHVHEEASGKLPVHIALEHCESNDNSLEQGLCTFMICYAGEGRGYKGWVKDIRTWRLSDTHGRTVRDYAAGCPIDEVRETARGRGWKSAYRQMVTMVAEGTTVDLLDGYVEGNGLVGYIADRDDEACFLHACIGFGRLDFLLWFEGRFFQKEEQEVLYRGLASLLGDDDSQTKLLPRIFCTPSERFVVGDKCEVLSSAGNQERAVEASNCMDGNWTLTGWTLYSDEISEVQIERFILRADAMGLVQAQLKVIDKGAWWGGSFFGECFVNQRDDILLTLHTNTENSLDEEVWYSTQIYRSNDAVIERVDFKRCCKRPGDGYVFWAENDRSITLAKGLAPLKKGVRAHESWQKAKIIDSTEAELKVTYTELDPAFEEWIPRDSLRINRTGSLKCEYYCPMTKEERESKVISGSALAFRYGHDDIVQWIESATLPAKLTTDLGRIHYQFIRTVFSQKRNDELDAILTEANGIAQPHHLIDSCAAVISSLEADHYVLGKCWLSQPPVGSCVPRSKDDRYNHHELRKLGLLRCMAGIGRQERVEWIIEQGFHPESDAARGALFDAAHGNHTEIVKLLVSHGVDARQPFAINAHKVSFFHDPPDLQEKSLIEVAVDDLNGDVVCYLIDENLVPRYHLQRELLSMAVRSHYLGLGKVTERKLKAASRLVIVKKLVSKGLNVRECSAGSRGDLLHEMMTVVNVGESEFEEKYVPVTPELVRWLCKKGCDLVSAAREGLLWHTNDLPKWLEEMMKAAESTWPVCDAVARGAPPDELKSRAEQSETDILNIRDREGRTMIQLATVSNQRTSLEWLVKAMGADIDEKDSEGQTVLEVATKLALNDMVQQIQWLRKWSMQQKKAEAAHQQNSTCR